MLSQYPVFPWVLADYTSSELDLTNPSSFRDLSKPMGALDPGREESFRERYASMQCGSAEDPHATPPFHYGTHYSSAAIVLHYLLRIQPFAGHHVFMQGGVFDHANRLFHSLEQVSALLLHPISHCSALTHEVLMCRSSVHRT